MSLKVKLTSLVLGVIFAMSMMIVGVLSATQVNLGIGGNVSFTAKGINCTISEGELNYGTKAADSMLGFTYSTTTAVDTTAETTFKNSWTGLNLNINENGDTLRINFTITNNAERSSNDCIKVTIDPTSSQGTLTNMKEIEYICPELITPQSTKSYSIIFQVDDKDVDASITGFDIKVKLEYQEVAPVDVTGGYNNMEFTKIEDGKASVGSPDDTLGGNVIIPSRVKLNGEILDVTTIGEHAFIDCSSITSISIPETITRINNNAFNNCPGITGLNLPDSLTYIGVNVFYACYGLTSITIPHSVKRIDDEAFSNCESLTSIILPDGLESIGDGVFNTCYCLANVTISSSVVSIGMEAIVNPYGMLESVNFERPSGWKVSKDGEIWKDIPDTVDLSDASQARIAISETYRSYYWKNG